MEWEVFMKTVTFSQLRNNAKKYFDAVEKGESVEVYRHGKPAAILSPAGEKHPGFLSPVGSPSAVFEPTTKYSGESRPKLLPISRLSMSRELMRDRGRDTIPISETKRFIQDGFGVLGTKGNLLKALLKERKKEKVFEDRPRRRSK
jgi:prevent-host-death family protein